MIGFNKTKVFRTKEAARQIGVSGEQLRYWERLGIVRPEYIQCGSRKLRRYAQEDIHRAVLVKVLLDNGKYTLADAIRKLEEEMFRPSSPL